MSLTASTMLALGSRAPDFRLPDPEGKVWTLDDVMRLAPMTSGGTPGGDRQAVAPALLVIFLCNHCPYVKHIRDELARLAREYHERGVAVVGISANDVTSHPDDRPEMMAREKAEAGYVFPYLYDEGQDVAKAYQAACTPDFYVFDRDRSLVYRGQMDGSRPGNGVPVTGKDLRAALDAVLAGQAVAAAQKPSMGCNIKWKPGNAPNYPG